MSHTPTPSQGSSLSPEPAAESLSPDELGALRTRLLDWYDHHGRTLPWRGTRDPYKIWVSEIILQQTRTDQGWDYYLRFIDRLPDVQSLAELPEDELMLLWQGLGYYSRAHNMQHAARRIMTDFGGLFPRDARDVASLKGVGPYTTAAIMSIAYDEPFAVVDGNVYRILSRYLAAELPIDTDPGQKYYRRMAQQLLDPAQPGRFNQAMMDLGATVCTPRSPRCDDCPLAFGCRSRDLELRELLPIKARKTKVTERWIDYRLLLRDDDTIAIRRRDTRRGIWKGLYELPATVSDTAPEAPTTPPKGWDVVKTIPLPDHRLTHRLLHLRVTLCRPTEGTAAPFPDDCRPLPLADHPAIAFPKPLRRFLDLHFPPPDPTNG